MPETSRVRAQIRGCRLEYTLMQKAMLPMHLGQGAPCSLHFPTTTRLNRHPCPGERLSDAPQAPSRSTHAADMSPWLQHQAQALSVQDLPFRLARSERERAGDLFATSASVGVMAAGRASHVTSGGRSSVPQALAQPRFPPPASPSRPGRSRSCSALAI